MRTHLCAVALLSVALLGAGCKSGPSLVGKWNAAAGGGSLDFEFKDDKTFTMGTKMAQFAMTAKGDYSLAGEKLTITTKDVDVPTMPALKEMAKKDPKFGKPQDVTIKFVSDDEVSLSGLPGAGAGAAPQAITLKRVK